MGSAISIMAFAPGKSSYDKNISYLEFVEREEFSGSIIYTYNIPVRFYCIDPNSPTMIVCHGNSEDIGQTNPKSLAELFNVNVCLFDYSGYGLHSNKRPSEQSCQKDAIAVYDYLVFDKFMDPESIIIYGRSLGTGVAAYLSHYLCQRNGTNKLILVSPLYSAASTVINMYVPGDIFLNYQLAPKIISRVLILHGNKDNVVPYLCGLKLSRLFPNLTKFVTLDDCGHNDVMNKSYIDEIKEFILL